MKINNQMPGKVLKKIFENRISGKEKQSFQKEKRSFNGLMTMEKEFNNLLPGSTDSTIKMQSLPENLQSFRIITLLKKNSTSENPQGS